MSKAIFRLRKPQELTRGSQESMVTVWTTESWATMAVQSHFPMSRTLKRPAQLTLAAGDSTIGTCSLQATVTAAATRCIFAKVPPPTGCQTHLASMTSNPLEPLAKHHQPAIFEPIRRQLFDWQRVVLPIRVESIQSNFGKMMLIPHLESKSRFLLSWILYKL